jgi:ADP-heptose:LPS heptosyltransferase
MSRNAPHNILVIKLSALGDFVLAMAAMKRIREAHPEARITLLTTAPYEQLAKHSPYFDEVMTNGRPQGAQEWLGLIAGLRRAHFDRVYDLQTSQRSNMIFQALGPFQPPWSGNAPGAKLRHNNPHRDAMHTLERHVDQLKDAGIYPDAPSGPYSAPPPDISWIAAKAAPERPKPAGTPPPRPYVLLVPGGSAHRLEKRWPDEHFARLAVGLDKAGFDVLIIGGPQEAMLAHVIQRTAKKARDLTGRTDFARIALLGAKAALAVGNDTGPLHLIAAAGAPTIALFSNASDPELSGPRGHVAILHSPDLADMPVEMVLKTAANLTPMPSTAAA